MEDAKIMLCTDVPYMADAVPKLFNDFSGVRVLRRRDLSLVRKSLFRYQHFVLGLKQPEESDWRLCKSIIEEGFSSVYLMLRNLPSVEDINKAAEIGIKDILLDPLYRIREMAGNEEELFSVLKAPESEEEVVYLGYGVSFHMKQLWVSYYDEKHPLTKLEAKLLKLFVSNKGVVLSKNEMAEKIWDGTIELSSVRKLVKRLREKLGPAHKMVIGRKQGGYIFKQEDV